jgi:putative membrane protein
MKMLNVFFKDMKAVIQKPMLLISFIAVAFIPTLYSGLLIEGSWDPYGHLDKLPVAVVNLDQGTTYEGETLDVGSDFVDELKKNNDFAWNFVSEEEARDGMVHNKYYMTITVPADFSTKAATLMDEHPQQAEIIFEPNSDYNFVAGQIGNSAIKELKSKLSTQITQAYTRSMFDLVDKISEGLGEAGHGADRLKEGAGKLEEGVASLKENLEKLADGTLKLRNGVKPLYEGAAALQDGASSLSKGTADLAAGLNQLSQAERQLEDGAIAVQKGTAQLEEGIQSSADGSSKLTAGLTSSAETSAQLADGAEQVAKGLEQLAKANPQLAKDPQVQQLLAASRTVAQGSARLKEGQQRLLEGSKQLDQGQQQLLQGVSQVKDGQSRYIDSLKQFGDKLSESSVGGEKLAEGASQVNEGASQLQRGLNELAGGVNNLADGSQKLDNGAGELKQGMLNLVQGSDELAGKLDDAADQTSRIQSGDDTVSMFAEPVKVTENTDRKVEKYGTGIAPYFLSMALFVGGLVFTTIVSLRDSSEPEATGMGRFVSRTLTFVSMSIAQSLIAGLVMLYGLGLEVKSAPLFLLFTFAASFTFSMIIQAIVTWLDNPGRFVVILILILQLTSSGGTFPVELLPGWMQKLNPWLPMTHSISGFKSVISSGDYVLLWKQTGYLAIYAVLFTLLTLLYFIRQKPGQKAD